MEIVFILIVLGLYFLPTIIACAREHHNSTAILVFNLVLGWTLLGWLLALVWGFTSNTKKEAA